MTLNKLSVRPRGTTPLQPDLRMKKILVPTDLSGKSLPALRYAADYAKHFNAQMIVLHVCKGQGAPGLPNFLLPDDPDKMLQSPQEKLDELCRQHISPELDAITLLRTSDTPFLEISEVAEEFKADLIVMTSGGSKALSDVFRGSTTERVIHHAKCSVLVVAARQYGPSEPAQPARVSA